MLNGHPTLAKLIGYCCGEEVEGVVYDLSPRDTLHNLIVKGTRYQSFPLLCPYRVSSPNCLVF